MIDQSYQKYEDECYAKASVVNNYKHHTIQ